MPEMMVCPESGSGVHSEGGILAPEARQRLAEPARRVAALRHDRPGSSPARARSCSSSCTCGAARWVTRMVPGCGFPGCQGWQARECMRSSDLGRCRGCLGPRIAWQACLVRSDTHGQPEAPGTPAITALQRTCAPGMRVHQWVGLDGSMHLQQMLQGQLDAVTATRPAVGPPGASSSSPSRSLT